MLLNVGQKEAGMILPIHSRSSKLTLSHIYTQYCT